MAAALKPEVFENRFWLRIMDDHLFIILDALNYREKDEIASARSLIKTYNELLERSWEDLPADQLMQLNQQAFTATQGIKEYKLHILKKQLTGSIAIGITSGLMSRLINEAEYYLDILSAFLQKREYVIKPIPLHLLWLIDAAGHAEIIANGLNYSNTDLIRVTRAYQVSFVDLFVQAIEMKGFFRIDVKDFPSFKQFNRDVNKCLTDFTEFFVELNSKIMDDRVPSTVSLLTLDHMYREECYYLTELSKVSSISPPTCDPTRKAFVP